MKIQYRYRTTRVITLPVNLREQMKGQSKLCRIIPKLQKKKIKTDGLEARNMCYSVATGEMMLPLALREGL